MASSSPLMHRDYTVGWICALPTEMAAAAAMLDERHGDLPQRPSDQNNYILGSIGDHNVAIACLGSGVTGISSAAIVAARMLSTFKSIRFGLMVGIGGGVPGGLTDIRLGDVVVSKPFDTYGGVMQYDFGKTIGENQFVRTGTLNKPPPVLLAAVSRLETEHLMGQNRLQQHLSQMLKKYPSMEPRYTYQGADHDQLFQPGYDHKNGDTCENCDINELVNRDQRCTPAIHYGLIASGNRVMRHGATRERLRKELGMLCFEMEAAGLMDNFPCLVIRGVCDYADTHKNKRWQGYAAATAAAYAKELLGVVPISQVGSTPTAAMVTSAVSGAAQAVIQAQQARLEAEIRQACHQTLRTSDYEAHKARNPDRVHGTCQWFLRHVNYRTWLESKTSSLLWVSADPGCGKSVLSKSLVDNELQSTETRTTCYFFFKEDNTEQKTRENALCALLHQLFSQNSILLQHAVPDFERDGSMLPQLFDALWRILTSAASDPEAGEIVCILDAVDECEETGRFGLISILDQFYRSATSNQKGARLKFLVTSRPYYDIERNFRRLTLHIPTIRLAGEEETESISREIDLVIKARVQEIGSDLGLDDSVRTSLERELLKITHRTYLWLKLILEVIHRRLDVTEKRLHGIIGTIPDTVDKAYGAILERSTDVRRARKLLHIIVSAARPLTLAEMNVALSIEVSSRSYEDLDLEPEVSFRTTVRNLCGLFVNIVDSRVYLIHQTAKEYLVNGEDNCQPSGHNDMRLGGWKHSLQPVESNRILATICVLYLLFSEFESDPPVRRMVSLREYTHKYVFLDYAAEHWAGHFGKIGIGQDTALLDSALDICCARSGRSPTWFLLYWANDNGPNDYGPILPTGLIVGSYLGLDSIVWQLLWKKSRLEFGDLYGNAPPMRAANRGHVPIVMLLEKDANMELTNWVWKTPLMLIPKDPFMPGKLLLASGANPDRQGTSGETLLSWAVQNQRGVLARLLLRGGASPDLEDIFGRTPLALAVQEGYEAMVELLLGEGANIESGDKFGQSLLSQAAQRGHEAIAKLLLERGADTESRDRFGQTPLVWVAQKGYRAIAKLLLENGADAESKDNNGWTPLTWAVKMGHVDLAKLLLEGGAKLESADKSGRTPLWWATDIGSETMARILLEKGAYRDPEDVDGDTPILRASKRGYRDFGRLVITFPGSSGSPVSLLLAAKYGYETIVRELLQKGSHPDPRDNNGRTPLSWASGNRDEYMVRMLLCRGADPDSKDNNRRTPLWWAAYGRCDAEVELLLQNGVDPGPKDDVGQTPLFCAARNGRVAIARMLLKRGVNVDSRDNGGQTPLMAAIQNGHDAMIKALLELGANPNSKDKSGKTPLSWAVELEHEDIAKLLLENGAEQDPNAGANRSSSRRPKRRLIW
ncbi:hypothetical protein FGG08_004417 [Glutinoglossum americanum]|uniref:Nucleoside phosphorylase domain-containing protein n=1 Tax=Glutinoglossum americanum TaxID=1670608 RepID=A0A9P8KZK5_9PEZI|nr:hypothetical protein FGG08_004417 [Glutinoglossum americanum]